MWVGCVAFSHMLSWNSKFKLIWEAGHQGNRYFGVGDRELDSHLSVGLQDGQWFINGVWDAKEPVKFSAKADALREARFAQSINAVIREFIWAINTDTLVETWKWLAHLSQQTRKEPFAPLPEPPAEENRPKTVMAGLNGAPAWVKKTPNLTFAEKIIAAPAATTNSIWGATVLAGLCEALMKSNVTARPDTMYWGTDGDGYGPDGYGGEAIYEYVPKQFPALYKLLIKNGAKSKDALRHAQSVWVLQLEVPSEKPQREGEEQEEEEEEEDETEDRIAIDLRAASVWVSWLPDPVCSGNNKHGKEIVKRLLQLIHKRLPPKAAAKWKVGQRLNTYAVLMLNSPEYSELAPEDEDEETE
eukprot:TRINITY_DN68107_c2_g1_i1.p1 TRINITY_DN68107_c2_g1~~TRINITY_DN68107_c2_g1_i1.p1  ORF type:complete len:358 (+),score=44.27 TRINITY_DN68107_c2_g1_i1:153-1226(+)